MTRMSKQSQRRAQSPRKRRSPSEKTGALKDNLPHGFKPHPNAIQGDIAALTFIPKVK